MVEGPLERRNTSTTCRGRTRAGKYKLPGCGGLLRAARQSFSEPIRSTGGGLFGSLTTGTATERNVVDLATRGLSPGDYFAALADLMALFDGPVDLVRLELAPPSLLDRIAAEGKPL